MNTTITLANRRLGIGINYNNPTMTLRRFKELLDGFRDCVSDYRLTPEEALKAAVRYAEKHREEIIVVDVTIDSPNMMVDASNIPSIKPLDADGMKSLPLLINLASVADVKDTYFRDMGSTTEPHIPPKEV